MLIYDGDCGFCTRCATWLEARLRTPVHVVPWQQVPDLAALGLTRDEVTTAVQWFDVFGRRWSGADAIGQCLRLCRPPWPAAGAVLSVPPVSWLARVVYRVVARNRHRLPGSTDACRLPDRRAGTPTG